MLKVPQRKKKKVIMLEVKLESDVLELIEEITDLTVGMLTLLPFNRL